MVEWLRVGEGGGEEGMRSGEDGAGSGCGCGGGGGWVLRGGWRVKEGIFLDFAGDESLGEGGHWGGWWRWEIGLR